MAETCAPAAEEGCLCLSAAAGEAGLHAPEVAEWAGCLAVAGLGQEGGGQSGLEEEEELEWSGWIPAQEAEAPVCQVEVVEAQKLQQDIQKSFSHGGAASSVRRSRVMLRGSHLLCSPPS